MSLAGAPRENQAHRLLEHSRDLSQRSVACRKLHVLLAVQKPRHTKLPVVFYLEPDPILKFFVLFRILDFQGGSFIQMLFCVFFEFFLLLEHKFPPFVHELGENFHTPNCDEFHV